MHNPAPSHEDATQTAPGSHVEVWNDLVSPRDLLVCLLISAACALVSLVLAAATGSQPLFWGLGGCVLGFAVSCLVVRPKREVLLVDDSVDDTVGDAAGDGLASPGPDAVGPAAVGPAAGQGSAR